MKFRVRQVNNKSKRVQNTLTRLQAEILPTTNPTKVDVGYWWIAYSEAGKPVGFAAMKQSSQFYDCAFFHRSGVLDEYTGNGIQKKLIKARLRKCKYMGFHWAVSDTTMNPASSNSLIACGFRLYEPSKPWGWKHTNYWRIKI